MKGTFGFDSTCYFLNTFHHAFALLHLCGDQLSKKLYLQVF